jgi:hypothetical protein
VVSEFGVSIPFARRITATDCFASLEAMQQRLNDHMNHALDARAYAVFKSLYAWNPHEVTGLEEWRSWG